MCNCKNTNGFQKALKNAQYLENKTGKKHAVYVLNNESFIGELSSVKKIDSICCYFLSNGKEILIEKVIKSDMPKKTQEEKK